MTYADFKTRIENHRRKIRKTGEIIDENKELLTDFIRDQRINDLSDARIHKLLSHLRPVVRLLDKSFEETTEDDVKDIIAWV
ncbi:hypothetical protein AKJ37_00145 [candidate division MSBL1 archaeon SCGC-AAA259I09]|uniref:Uncharacterized protein n=4 Tax=candidate division MSBL1 TaxID=215777 RepID=A0A133UW37_9EURY|nr:hypothetical protein AKJ61_00435 [candidate division MSBL1 archaeon SCGC-AAA259B11]KXA94382.1 hypothetical protein AKJ36_02985 [candidate division MSBL1 archaeon SCGC-AAA259I07]KXA98408.1 hypothetical protein AKJ37_00145 [candidate division MSBL1 archaeon SCGC-AAA259I09]KXB00375.1 hypothetical protein AKJ40_01425 [candidate division MSBL1 archaeon SCGC-AAA259M10]